MLWRFGNDNFSGIWIFWFFYGCGLSYLKIANPPLCSVYDVSFIVKPDSSCPQSPSSLVGIPSLSGCLCLLPNVQVDVEVQRIWTVLLRFSQSKKLSRMKSLTESEMEQPLTLFTTVSCLASPLSFILESITEQDTSWSFHSVIFFEEMCDAFSAQFYLHCGVSTERTICWVLREFIWCILTICIILGNIKAASS